MTDGAGGATYRSAGVDIEAGEHAVELIHKVVAASGATRSEVIGGIGGFAGAFSAVFRGIDDPVLVSGTDGVGTKVMIAQAMHRHDTVGIDAVAMVVDDIVCSGAEPLFVLDYLACGRNDPDRTAEIVSGVAEGCRLSGAALLGGETAEHPGVMADDEYDLATFAVGVVARPHMLGPERVRAGDAVIGLASSGLHSNGYSLVRRLILDNDLSLDVAVPDCAASLGEELLKPCRIHAPAVLSTIQAGVEAHAAAHVTQGGIGGNLVRVLPDHLGARLDFRTWTRQPIFDFLQQTGSIPEAEMRRVFNCGLGMLLVVAQPDGARAIELLVQRGESATIVGSVVEVPGVEIE